MDHNEILSELNILMRDIFDEDDLIVADDTIAEDVDAWDSANHVRLMIAVMEKFRIQFSGKEVLEPENVGQLVDMIAAKLKT